MAQLSQVVNDRTIFCDFHEYIFNVKYPIIVYGPWSSFPFFITIKVCIPAQPHRTDFITQLFPFVSPRLTVVGCSSFPLFCNPSAANGHLQNDVIGSRCALGPSATMI
jgi:hypothetical protein